MKEIPTVRVDPLHPQCDHWCEFPVADRPDAVAKWLLTADARLGDFVLIIETDYIWTKPVPLPPDAVPVAYKYDYINPSYPGLPQIMKHFYNGSVEDIPHTGPAPVLIRTDLLRQIVPTWLTITAEIENTPQFKQTLGWVREMYAYSLAVAVENIPHRTETRGLSVLIAQPPADDSLGKAAMYHYTWGCNLLDPGDSNRVVWEWDKRKYVAPGDSFRIPRVPLPPPVEEILARGLIQHYPQKRKMTRELALSLHQMIGIMNEAADDLPVLKACGWVGSPPCR